MIRNVAHCAQKTRITPSPIANTRSERIPGKKKVIKDTKKQRRLRKQEEGTSKNEQERTVERIAEQIVEAGASSWSMNIKEDF